MKKEHIEWLTQVGWKKSLIEGGLGVFYIDLKDRRLVTFSSFRFIADEARWNDSASVSTQALRKAASYLENRRNETAWLAQRKNSRSRGSNGGSELVQQRTQELIDWAMKVDLAAEFQSLLEDDPKNRRRESHKHIVCLAAAGKTNLLERYQKNLEAGESELFGMVKQHHLERAIEYSKQI